MNFDEFLNNKKISYYTLKLDNPKLYNTLEYEYTYLGKFNFDFNKKYLFNKIRLLYPLE